MVKSGSSGRVCRCPGTLGIFARCAFGTLRNDRDGTSDEAPNGDSSAPNGDSVSSAGRSAGVLHRPGGGHSLGDRRALRDERGGPPAGQPTNGSPPDRERPEAHHPSVIGKIVGRIAGNNPDSGVK